MADNGTTPDFYADGVTIGVGRYGVVISFLLSDIEQPDDPGRVVGKVRLSLELAQAIANDLGERVPKTRAAGDTLRADDADKVPSEGEQE